MQRMARAVLFDLDDTLFDHRTCARTALLDLHRAHPAFAARDFESFARLHAGFLEELHHRVIAGELNVDDARRERFRRLLQASGSTAEDEVVVRLAAAYRDGYVRIRQPIEGAVRLLDLLRARARVGIVSNNLLEEQQTKLRQCGLEPYVDVLVVSEEVGVWKPDPRIFEIALDRIGCAADDVVMVGDSWAADVIGARAAGIRAIWFNPLGQSAPDPAAPVPQLRSLEPAEAAIQVIFHQEG
jgi:YjjG family noncanonical pyrimidine nucleotidase